MQNLIKYAESKNTILIGFVIALIGFLKSQRLLYNNDSLIFFISIILLILSLLISLLSMIPKTKQIYARRRKIVSNPNLFLFSDIACIQTKDEFIEIIQREYFNNEELNKEEKDIAKQIYTLSNIVLEKFRAFNIAISIFTIGLILTFLTILL
ncbi:MAG: DUF5706 domain-containing protein [Spirochaetia bacterium]|nr:DUF5706 domain-containing protein [Spirochaetia bacterium]